MRATLLLFALLFTLSAVKAQKKQNIYFFKNNGKEVNSKDSADFVRAIQEPDSGETNFVYLEFFADGKRKTVGKVSAFEPSLVLEGTIISFNKAGRRIKVANYQHGMPIGMTYQYFGDGTLRRQVEYVKFTQPIDQMVGSDVGFAREIFNTGNKLVYLADSLGTVYVKQGNGHVVETISLPVGERREEGDYKDGLKDGIWKGAEDVNAINYTETYQMGKLISGESTRDGKQYTYATAFEPPQFKGGTAAWSNYIKNTLAYPKDAFKNGIQGRVQTTFTVDRDGKIIDINITRSADPLLDEEAKRILLRSPLWVPAKMRGIPVKVKYNQPFNFRLP
jgi:TonB family protein